MTCTLIGGDPIAPIADLFKRIRPLPRQRDTRVVVIVDLLLHAPFTSLDAVGAALQTDPEGAGAALRAAAQCTAPNAPLIDRYGDAWLLGATAREAVMPAREAPWFADVVAYASTRFDECRSTTRLWCQTFGPISTGDLMRLAGVSRGTAQKVLTTMTGRGELRRTGSGRATAYRLADRG